MGMDDFDPDELNVFAERFKRAMRERMKSLREATPEATRRAHARAIVEAVRGLEAFASAREVLSYAPVRGEVDVSALEADVRARGGRFILPRVSGEALVLHEVPEGEALHKGAFGIPEPSPDWPRVDPAAIEFVLVPALAVDERGGRLGWGGGFYDRLLKHLKDAFRCAVIYDFQLVSEVPQSSHDEAVHAVVSERGSWVLRGG